MFTLWKGKVQLKVIVVAVLKGLIPGAVLGMISLLFWQLNPRLGSFVLLIGSFALVAKSYRKDWLMKWYSCLLPPATVTFCFFAQMIFLGVRPPLGALLPGVAAGLLLGFLRGIFHKFYEKDGQIYAKRTIWILLIWLGTYLLSQSAALFHTRYFVGIGLCGGAFGSSIVVMFSLVVFCKYVFMRNALAGQERRGSLAASLGVLASFLFFSASLFAASSIFAQNNYSSGNAASLGTYKGAPPAVDGWGIRFGKTEYQAELNPKIVQLLNTRKRRWYRDKERADTKTALKEWRFSGGRLTVDWDAKTARMTPIKFSHQSVRQYDDQSVLVGHQYYHNETQFLKQRKSNGSSVNLVGTSSGSSGGGGAGILSPVRHGFGHEVQIGKGTVATRYDWTDVTIFRNGKKEQAGPHGSSISSTNFYIGNTIHVSSDGWRNRRLSSKNKPLMHRKQGDGYSRSQHSIEPGLLEYGWSLTILDDALKMIGAADQEPAKQGEADIIFRPVQTVGRAPAAPRLTSEKKSSLGGWKRKMAGKETYRGHFLRAVSSNKDIPSAGKILKDFKNAACSGAQLTIDWDKKTAMLSPFNVRWKIKTHKGRHVNDKAESFTPQTHKPGKVRFNAGGFREITGGELTYGYTHVAVDTKNKKKGTAKTTFRPVTFRGKPVRVQWQAIAQDGGAILVRIYVRPWADKEYRLPAYYDILFQKGGKASPAAAAAGDRGGSNTGATKAPRPEKTTAGSQSANNASANAASASDRLTDEEADRILDALLANRLPASAVSAGLAAGLLMLTLGSGLQAALAVANVFAQMPLPANAAGPAGALSLAPTLNEPHDARMQEAAGQAPAGQGDSLLLDPDGTALIDENGEPWYCNPNGKYGIEGDNGETIWMTRAEAERSIQDARDVQYNRDREREDLWNDVQQDSNAWMDRKGAEGLASQQAWADNQAAEKAARIQKAKDLEKLLKKIDKASGYGQNQFDDLIDKLKDDRDYEGLKQAYYYQMQQQVRDGAAESDWENTKSNLFWLGEKTAQATLSASKGAMMIAGGPAGAAYTGLGMGTISAAEEGAAAQARGENLGSIMAHSAGGFVTGAKDAAVSVYVNMPGTSKIVKVLLPAGSDAAEIYIRTGDTKQALKAAGYSAVSDVVGMQNDKIGGRATRELADAATTATIAGTRSYHDGGSFLEGAGNGLLNHVGGKAGGAMGGRAIDTDPAAGVDLEENVKKTMAQAFAESNKTIKTEDLPDSIKTLNNTRRPATAQEGQYRTDADGHLLTDADGNPITKAYVDPSKALDQLQDTQASRTTKQAEDDVKNAIIDTRSDLIYKPANHATLEAVKNSPSPETQQWLKENMRDGDTLEMDGFSTPGKSPSLGADRDVRMIIKRHDPDTGKAIKIEVPRKHWEDQAYKDFYEHGKNLHTQAGRDLDAEMDAQINSGKGIYASRRKGLKHLEQPEFSDAQSDKMRSDIRTRLQRQNDLKQQMYANKVSQDEMNQMIRTPEQIDAQVEKSIERIKNQGLTAEQIKHRTFAEAHNQLFTDQHHMEASRGNADQGFKTIENQGVERTQVRSNVLDAKDGTAQLSDPEGFSRMWAEKSHFYHDNPPEALAQSKKGIAEMLGLREGQRAQGLAPAPLKPETAQAMEVIIKAPTGTNATPEAIAQVNRDIQAIKDSHGNPVYKDYFDAMNKIGRSVEFNKLTPPAGLNPEAVSRSGGLTGSEAARIARLNQEREWARELNERGQAS